MLYEFGVFNPLSYHSNSNYRENRQISMKKCELLLDLIQISKAAAGGTFSLETSIFSEKIYFSQIFKYMAITPFIRF